jgi:plastocyanin
MFFFSRVDVAHTHTPSISPYNGTVCNIDIQDFSFNPSSITILSPNTGTGQNVMISWFNHGSYLHSITSGTPDIPDGLIDVDIPPQSYYNLTITPVLYSEILTKYPNGTIPYFCSFHYSLGMQAKLTISIAPGPELSFPIIFLFFLLTIAFLSAIILGYTRYHKRSSKT